ncbi:RING finger domain-containing protein [Endozoicomonas sp. 2B-B]
MNGTRPPGTPPGTPPSTPSPSAPYQEPTDNCPVCLESFADREVSVLEDCRHMFHKDCVAKWLSANSICPVCRTSLRAREAQPVPAMPLSFQVFSSAQAYVDFSQNGLLTSRGNIVDDSVRVEYLPAPLDSSFSQHGLLT